MKKDVNLKDAVIQCEDALVAIGDLALSGARIQLVAQSGIVSDRVPRLCSELFTEIAELAGAASAGNDE